jgi:DNA invertase Pin-like site-specific DNA recombinase
MLARHATDLRPDDLAGRRWAGYIRESTRGQADRYGPAIQRDEQAAWAARHGLIATELEYIDLVSGKDTIRRSDFRRMLADAEAGRFEVLLCYDTSRFARNVADAYRYREQLERAGVVVVFCADGLIAGNTETYELEGLKTVSDAGYLRRLSRNVGRGYAAKWERFNDPGGRPPLGFARTGPHQILAPIEGPDLETVRQLFARYATGTASDASLGYALGLSEFRVEEILANPLYAGRAIRHKGRPDEEERPASFPPPIDPVLFERVQRVRAERRTRHGGGGGFARRPYPLIRLLRCAGCASRYRGDAVNGRRRIRHITRPACTHSLTHRADAVEEQVAELMDGVRLNEADIDAVLAAVRVAEPAEAAAEQPDMAQERAELQDQLAAGHISLEAFTRAWKRVQRPIPLPRQPGEMALRQARGYLEAFGALWRDPDVPDELREEAAREIFERLDLWGPKVVAVYPRAEHAWMLGMAARKSEGLVLVGARGFEPPTPWPPAKCAARLRHAPTVAASIAEPSAQTGNPSSSSFVSRDMSSATAVVGGLPSWITARTCSAIGSSTPCSAASSRAPMTVVTPSATPPSC